jgi:DNA-binding transcriptional MerR regulator
MAARFLGTTDAALRLGCSAERVRQLEWEGKLSAERMASGQRVFYAEDVDRLASERERQKKEQVASAA